MKYISDLILAYLGKRDHFVQYMKTELSTTRNKKVDIHKAIRDLGHSYQVKLAEGIPRTIDWMRGVYQNQKITQGLTSP